MNLLQKYKDPNFWDKMEFYRFSIMGFTITFGTCLSSIAVLYLFDFKQINYFIPLSIVTIFTMGSNAAAISQSPLKWVVSIFLMSILVSIFFIFYAFFI